MEITEKEAEKFAEYIIGVKENANKFSNYVQATAVMFDMEVDEMGLAIADLIEANISNILRNESAFDVARALEYIDAVVLGLNKRKDMIMKEHVENRKS